LPLARHAVKAATSMIPIVVAFGHDPVQLGLAASLNRPGGNVTGATFVTTELVSKRIELLCEVVPQAMTVGYLNPGPQQSLPATEQMTSEVLAAARILGRQVLVLQVDTERDFEQAFETLGLEIAPAAVYLTTSPRLAEPFRRTKDEWCARDQTSRAVS